MASASFGLPFCAAVAVIVAVAVTPSAAVRYKGTYLCNWLVKLEEFFLCKNDMVMVMPNGLMAWSDDMPCFCAY